MFTRTEIESFYNDSLDFNLSNMPFDLAWLNPSTLKIRDADWENNIQDPYIRNSIDNKEKLGQYLY